MGNNPILMGQAEPMQWRYFVQMDEGRALFENGENLLEFLRNNDPSECGAILMTEYEFKKITERSEEEPHA